MSKRKRQQTKRARAQRAGQPILNPHTHPDAAGIDIGSMELVAALPPDRCAAPVRTFTAFTSGVHALRDWLLEHQIKTVAIESTGNYWITVYDVLEEAGSDVWSVNARAVKGVPGKKTDVCDAQWLQPPHWIEPRASRSFRWKRSLRRQSPMSLLRKSGPERAGLMQAHESEIDSEEILSRTRTCTGC